jgi:3-deoxy-D-manno-octulosonic acid (KDO) 8-phosphate synthase
MKFDRFQEYDSIYYIFLKKAPHHSLSEGSQVMKLKQLESLLSEVQVFEDPKSN